MVLITIVTGAFVNQLITRGGHIVPMALPLPRIGEFRTNTVNKARWDGGWNQTGAGEALDRWMQYIFFWGWTYDDVISDN